MQQQSNITKQISSITNTQTLEIPTQIKQLQSLHERIKDQQNQINTQHTNIQSIPTTIAKIKSKTNKSFINYLATQTQSTKTN